MIAVDTNILVRYTMRDDPQQTEVATRFLHEHDCLVLRSVVMELVWVLSSGLGIVYPRKILQSVYVRFYAYQQFTQKM